MVNIDPGMEGTDPSQANKPAAKPAAPAPTTPTPEPTTSAKPATPAPTTTVPSAPAAPTQTSLAKGTMIKPGSVAANAVSRKKALVGCLGAFAGLLLLSLILAFVFLAQSSGGDSAVARLLGVDSGAFINGLIAFVHMIFILASLTAFTFTMVGLFKASMAKKDDKVTKEAGKKMTIVAGVSLVVILMVWIFVYIYLDSKRVDMGNGPVAEIVTDPEDPTNLSSPVEVKFDAKNIEVDERKFKIVAYDWNFGDKSSGTGQVTSHTYTEKGVFTVTLTVTVEDRTTNELIEGGKFTKIVSISNESLAAVFTADPDSGEAPLKVKFDATGSKDPDGEIASYEWDLDEDGNFDDETKPQFEYELKKVGTYKIGLRVTSTTGDFNIYEKEIVVKEQVGPEAKITVVGEPTEFNPGVTYTFKADDSTSPNGKITKYEWDFGDDSKVATTKTVTHSYTQIGKYELKLKLTDETKEEGEVTMTIDVKPPKTAPKAVIKTDPAVASGSLVLEGKTPFAVAFDARETTDPDDNIVDYQWDFNNDGTADAYEATVNHTFTQSGNYTVTLSVIDADNNIGKTTLLVKVAERGVTAILTADKVAGEAPLSVAFDASGSTYPKGQITSYRWDFGDGTPQKLGTATITHQYVQVGTYTAKVTVIGADNTTDISTLMITVRDTQLASCFTSTFTEGPAPLNVTFDPSCSAGAVSRYFWDFGDSGTSTDIKPNHTFTTAGKYKVTLEVADSDKNTAKSEVMIDVQ